MPVSFQQMREFEGQRVLMRFDDGVEVIAHLLSAVEDMDGGRHLIYENVEWASDPQEIAKLKGSVAYAEGESLVAILAAPRA
jgi:hypothetical protein